MTLQNNIRPGTPMEGGFYATTRIDRDGRIYHLIVSPRADMADDPMTWQQAVSACSQLRTGGKDDWQLPSRAEALALYEALGPKLPTTPEIFRAGATEAFAEEWYWTGQEYEFNRGYAWVQSFNNGGQGVGHKYVRSHCRAVRKVLI